MITRSGITQFFGPTTADASTQGAQEADLAVAADQAFGIMSGIIYTDIENYTVNSTCSPLVQAYVDAWVSEIHVYPGYIAAVYANPGPINSDIHNQSVAPADVIWVTKVSSPPQVTIWNQGISDSWWPNGQRLHQFLIDQTGVNWGGVAFNPSVDDDIENGPVVNANNGAKTPSSYTYTRFNYPGAIYANPTGINDIWDTGLINGPGLVGQIVGWYFDGSTAHGFLLDGLVGYTPINYPGALETEATGINNLGQLVGQWQDSNYNNGFLLDNATCSAYCSFDYPGATETFPNGINDAGQIVGSYDNATGEHGFLYYRGNGGKFYSIDYPGAADTIAYGINGDGVIAGCINDYNPGFAEYPVPPAWIGSFSAINYPGATITQVYGVNNDDQMIGDYQIADDGAALGFQSTYGILFTSFQYPGSTSGTTMSSGNDFGQIVGFAPPTAFVVTPSD